MRFALLAVSSVCLIAMPALGQSSMPLPESTANSTGSNVNWPAAGCTDGWDGPKVWGSVDYLRWWITPMNSPELIQVVPGDLAASSVSSGTTIPGGGTRFFPDYRQAHFGAFNGLRGTLGFAGDYCGFDVTAFYLESKTLSGSLFTTGFPNAVGQPYVSTVTGSPTTLFASLPGSYTGGVNADLSSRVWGFDANARIPSYRMLADWNHALVGFRYFDLQESLNVSAKVTFPDGGTGFNNDSIRTRNQFYGAQVGVASRFGTFEGVGLDSAVKLALGDMRQQAILQGSNGLAGPGMPPDVVPGGLYVQPSNAGTYTRDKVAFLTEYDLNLTYNFSERTQVYFGYSIIYVSSVQRPGEAIDQTINDSRVRYIAVSGTSDANRPTFKWNANDFWTQGLNFGVRFQY